MNTRQLVEALCAKYPVAALWGPGRAEQWEVILTWTGPLPTVPGPMTQDDKKMLRVGCLAATALDIPEYFDFEFGKNAAGEPVLRIARADR